MAVSTLKDAREIDAGLYHPTSGIPAGGYVDIEVSFNRTFTTPPHVVVGFSTASTEGAFGKCCCSVKFVNGVGPAVTTTGFTLRAFNGDVIGRSPNYIWIAIA